MHLVGDGRLRPCPASRGPSSRRRIVTKVGVVLPARGRGTDTRSNDIEVLHADPQRRLLAHALQLGDPQDIGSTHAASSSSSSSSSSSQVTALRVAPAEPSTSGNSDNISSRGSSAAVGSHAAAADATAAAFDPSDEAELQQEFHSCGFWEDVLDVVADEALHMTPRNTVTALGRLHKLTRGAPRAERAGMLADARFLQLLRLLDLQLPRMNAFQLVNSLHSCAAMGTPLDRLPALLGKLDAALLLLVPQFNDRDVCSSLYAYASLGHTPPEPVLAALATRAQALLIAGRVEAQGVSMLLWATAKLGAEQQPAVSVMVGEALAALERDGALARALTSQGAANVAWAAARMGRARPALLKSALSAIAREGDRWKPQEVLNVLWACVRARHHPQQDFNAVLSYAARQAARLSGADVANLFHALGTFGVHPGGAALEAVLPRARALLPSMSAVEVCTVYWGMGLARCADNAVFESIQAQRLPALAASGALPPSLLRQAFQGFLAARLAGAAGPPLDAQLRDAMRGAWEQGLRDVAAGDAVPGGERSAAAVGGQVSATLRELGVAASRGVPTADGLAVVDVALTGGGGRPVALQIAAVDMYAANTGQQLGAAQWLRGVLERNGWDVYFLALPDWVAMPMHSRPALLVELLAQLGISVSREAKARAVRRREEGHRAAAPAAHVPGAGGDGGRDAPEAALSGAAAQELARSLLGGQQGSGMRAGELDVLMGGSQSRKQQQQQQPRRGRGRGSSSGGKRQR